MLLTPKWLAGHVLALSLIVLFTTFGFWQLGRLGERQQANAVVAERMAGEAQPLGELRERYGEEPDEWAYRRVTVRGRYDHGSEMLLRSRSRDGQPGWHVLTPLVQQSGMALLVDRGWVPYRMDDPPVEAASPPGGSVFLEGLVRAEQDPPEGWLSQFAPRDPEEGPLRTAYYVDVERLAAQLPYPLEPVYLELSAQTPANEGTLPLPSQTPELERGSHLSYALQWFTFALIGVVGYGLLLRSTVQSRRGAEKSQ